MGDQSQGPSRSFSLRVTRSPFFFLAIALPALAGFVFGLVWFLSAPRGEENVTAVQGKEEPATSAAGPAGTARSPAPDRSPAAVEDEQKVGAIDDEDGGHLEESADVDVSERHSEAYFAPPVLTGQGHYTSHPQPVTWSSSCARNPSLKSFRDLRDFVSLQHGLPLEVIPSEVIGSARGTGQESTRRIMLVHLNQYYRDLEAKEYLQVSIVHRGSGQEDEGYRIERYRFRDPEMAEMLGMDIVAPPSHQFDLDGPESRRAMASELGRLKGPRFVLGTRGLVFRSAEMPLTGAAATRASKKPFEAVVELTGGLVSAYTTQQLSCEATPFSGARGGTTFCTCYDNDSMVRKATETQQPPSTPPARP